MRIVTIFCILALILGSWAVNTQASVTSTIQTPVVTVESVQPPTDLQNGAEFNDPEFVKVLNNYFGCKTWENGVCIECSARFVFNANQVCCEIKPQCKTFNVAVGICEECYQGFKVVDGVCIVNTLVGS